MATALISALTKRPTRRDVAMTGEITLRGRVLPIGGIKEKVLAAHRAGIKTFILPKRNMNDLADVPREVVRELRFVPVDRMDQVIHVALSPEPLPVQEAPLPKQGHGQARPRKSSTHIPAKRGTNQLPSGAKHSDGSVSLRSPRL